MSGSLAGMRIGLLTASASRLGGGVFEAAVSHARMIRSRGGEVAVYALRDAYSAEDEGRWEGIPVSLGDITGPGQIGFSKPLASMLDAGALDCVHLHGIWMYPSAAGVAWSRRTGRPYFISPHGMLDPWITGRGRWKKALARVAYERAGWRRATAMHALTASEAGDIARESGRNDSLIVPNAGPTAAAPRLAMPEGTIVYIGRIHAKKNLVALVEGWKTSVRPADARLVVAGWGDDEAVSAVRDAVATCNGTATFVGPIFGAYKQELLAAARFVVLPSHSEGLPMAILEAWAEGIPTLMTHACNLPEGFGAGAALDCGEEPAVISEALTRALAMTQDRWLAMSQAALTLARGPFSEENVAERWCAIYSKAIQTSRTRVRA